jgi:hypothetical protein
MRRSWATIGVAALLALAACGRDEGVQNQSSEEAAQLDNAAEMLDASPDSLAVPENAPIEMESNNADKAENAVE